MKEDKELDVGVVGTSVGCDSVGTGDKQSAD